MRAPPNVWGIEWEDYTKNPTALALATLEFTLAKPLVVLKPILVIYMSLSNPLQI